MTIAIGWKPVATLNRGAIMTVKKHDLASIATIVIFAAVLVYTFMTGDPALLGRLLKTQENVTAAPALDEPQDGEIVTVEIANDGDIIEHSERLRLQGSIEFTGKKGDRLVLQRHGDAWVEIGRYFVGEDM